MAPPVKEKKASDKKDKRDAKLTIPDLVVLSLLAERPMHGYDVNTTLEERKIRDWAPVSRPQIYYSLDKLLKLKLTRVAKDDVAAAGPERHVFETTANGRDQLAEALEARHWTDDRAYQPFQIWLALSWLARGDTFRVQLEERKKVVLARIAEERATLDDVIKEVGHRLHEAVWMLELFIEQAEVEVRWINKVLRNAGKRAPSRAKAVR
ncbi:MAG TPA: PadR family transcriptional regulator [Pyrinomonadaceae bacterium]|jgi:DNA-binding PadR family transcriptional regulator